MKTISDILTSQTTDVLRPKHLKGKSLKTYVDQMTKGATLLFSFSGYKAFKVFLRADEYVARVDEVDGDKWKRATWTSPNKPDINVEFSVLLYENAAGYKVRGKRVSINTW